MDLVAAYARCDEITLPKRGTSHGIRLLPGEKRQAMSALYAFARRVDDIGDGSAPVEEKLVSLGAVRASLQDLDTGSVPDDDPVLVAAADAARRYPIRVEELAEVVEGCEMDVPRP